MKLDIYNHVFPVPFFERLQEVMTNHGPIKRWLNIPVLYDVDARLRMMETFGDYQQILSLSAPALEYVAGPDLTPELARLANDGMADLCKQHPDRFPSFIASLPMNNPDACIVEIDRAIKELNACGVQIFSNVNGKPLDAPEFFPIFERMAQHDLPLWLHPTRDASFPDYATEDKSLFEIWWTFGWSYETSAAMARLVFSRMFDKLPNIKIIAHHLGALVPYVEGRVGHGWDQLGTRTPGDEYTQLLESMDKRPIDYFKMFYVDTAVFGSFGATRCGFDFYGPERCLFASDCPFDPEGGPMYIRETIQCLDDLEIDKSTREDIYLNNARKLMKLG